MFTKDSKTGPALDSPAAGSRGAQPGAGTPSIISSDLKIVGNLESNGDVQIDGKIEGDVASKSVTIGETAEVNGTVSCERVRVCGKVSGEIRAESVVLARSARVDGDIVHKSLEIEAGASMQGRVRRLEGEADAPAKKDDKAAAGNVSKITEAKASASAGGNGSAAAL